MTINPDQISCIVLAGGEGKRVGGLDKGLIPFKNKLLVQYVIDSVKSRVDDIVISANRNIELYEQYCNKVVNDSSDSYRGPLAGIAACLPHCKHEHVLVVACDMPQLPLNLAERLFENLQKSSICIATVDTHHQLAMIIKKDLLDSIQQQLNNNQLKLIQWVKSVSYHTTSFDDMPAAFINVNRLSDTDK